MVKFVQGGIPCRCGDPDTKCGLHGLRKPVRKDRGK